MADGCRLGIVIVTRNRAETLLDSIEKLRAGGPAYPIVVVDNASTDGTVAAIQQRYPEIQTISLPDNIGGVARNYGVRRLSCEYIAFSDDDSWWEPGSLQRAVEILDRYPCVALIAARVLAGPEQRLDPTSALMRQSPLPGASSLPGPPVLGFMACAVVVRREAFLQAGGYHEWFGTGGEETYVAVRLAQNGWRSVYVDELVVHHFPSPHRRMEERIIEGHANRLWEAWLFRQRRAALRSTLRSVGRAVVDPEYRRGFARAASRLPSIIRQRQPVDTELEASLRLLEEQRAHLAKDG